MQAGAGGGCLVDGGDHRQASILKADFDADAAERSFGGLPQALEFVAVQVSGVRVQFAEHAAHGVANQRAVVDLFDVGALDTLEDFGKRLDVFQRQRVRVWGRLCGSRQGTQGKDQQASEQGDQRASSCGA